MDLDEVLRKLLQQADRPKTNPEESIADYIKHITKHRDDAIEAAAKFDAILRYLEEHPDSRYLIHLVKDV